MKRTELLAPAGNLEVLKSAVAAGADAVYFGGEAFNARAGAGNLSTEEIGMAIELCRFYHVKTNLTVNTLVKESEWEALKKFLDEVLSPGPDACIVQDLGVARYIRANFPKVELHASTQMAIHDVSGVIFLEKEGFTRAVLARELSLPEIRSIRENTKLELEVFVHGALCYSYSGRCLLSSFHGGRSGNRGQCAGSCRLPYKVGGADETSYPLNLKDLCGLPYLEELLKIGIDALKIEGRLKGIPYVCGVVSQYRAGMDSYYENGHVTPMMPAEETRLKTLFNRGGFTTGYLEGLQHSDAMLEPSSPKHQGVKIGYVCAKDGSRYTVKTTETLHAGDVLEFRSARIERQDPPQLRLSAELADSQKNGLLSFRLAGELEKGDGCYRLIDAALNEELISRFEKPEELPLSIFADVKRDVPMHLTACCWDSSATVFGEIPEEAKNRALTQEELIKSLSKLGGTRFKLEYIEAELEEGLFVSVSALNALRRAAVEALQEKLCEDTRAERVYTENNTADQTDQTASVSVSVRTAEQWRVALREKPDRILPHYALATDPNAPDLIRQTKAAGIALTVELSPLSRPRSEEAYEKDFAAWEALGVTSYEAQHLGDVERILEKGYELRCGFFMPVMNRENAAFLQNHGAKSYFISAELTEGECRALKNPAAILPAYGHLPLMLSAQCQHGEVLTDRKGEKLISDGHCDLCYNLLLDGKPLYLGRENLDGYSLRLVFTIEDAKETEEVLRAFRGKKPLQATHTGHFHSKVI